jgi:plastocyanin
MRKALLLLASIVSLAAAAVALAAVTRVVAIKPTGFSPDTRTIQTGDTIRWRNDDTVNHQVVADNGHFASPVLRPGQAYTREFDTAGTYRYRDALEPAERGTIVVRGPAPSVSIGSSAGTVFYGAGIRLTGVISSGNANATVEIWSRPYNQASFAKETEVKTVTAGGYDWSDVPTTLTYYQARWGSRASAVVTVGGWVYVQRKSRFNQWVNVKKVRLGGTGAKRFKLTLARGRHALRVFMTTNQAGSGYLWSHSRTLVYRKR